MTMIPEHIESGRRRRFHEGRTLSVLRKIETYAFLFELIKREDRFHITQSLDIYWVLIEHYSEYVKALHSTFILKGQHTVRNVPKQLKNILKKRDKILELSIIKNRI